MPAPDRRLVMLTNPTSGKGRGARAAHQALACFREAGYDVQSLAGSDAEAALDLAAEVVADGVGTLVVCGGDGMVHLAAQALAGSGTRPNTRLGIVPAGTGNDVARYLDLPRRDPRAAAETILRGRTRTIDLARVGARHFVTVLAAGFDAVVNERANAMTWPRGQMRYDLATLAELRVLRPIPYVLEVDGQEIRTEATLVAVGNGPSFGGGLRITEGALLDDGLLDVVIIKPLSAFELLKTYPKLFSGTHVHHPDYVHHRARSVTVAAPGIVAYADGERIDPLPLTVDAVPGALTVCVP